MQVNVGAKCWDGFRGKTLSEQTTTPVCAMIVEPGQFFERVKNAGIKLTKDKKVMAIVGFAVPLLLLSHGLPPFGITRAFAAAAGVDAMGNVAVPVMSEALKSKVISAFEPLMHLAQWLSYPIAGVMISVGCLFIMIGNREKGIDMLKNAAIGYILVALAPLFLQLLVDISSGLI